MLHLTTGTMFTGKTARLINDARALANENNKVLVARPSLDTRSPEGFVRSRNGEELECFVFSNVQDLKKECENNYDAILIDELQFISLDAMQYIIALAASGIPIYCYGLLSNFNGDLFPSTKYAIICSENTEFLLTSCAHCEDQATFNQFTGEKNDSGVVVGHDDEYKAVCLSCFLGAR